MFIIVASFSNFGIFFSIECNGRDILSLFPVPACVFPPPSSLAVVVLVLVLAPYIMIAVVRVAVRFFEL